MAAAQSLPADAVLLYTSTPSNILTETSQRQIIDILEGKRIQVSLVDGSAEANRSLRSSLWGISQKRAVYPQLFARNGEIYTFIGDGDALRDMVEQETLDSALAPLKRKQ